MFKNDGEVIHFVGPKGEEAIQKTRKHVPESCLLLIMALSCWDGVFGIQRRIGCLLTAWQCDPRGRYHVAQRRVAVGRQGATIIIR